LWEEKNPGAAIDSKISNRTAVGRCVEAGTKNRESEVKFNGRGAGQENAPASP
jgi:hypothetical protein